MTFNPWTFLLEAVNFVVLAYVLHRLLYRPLRQAVEERREAARRVQAEAEKARQEAATLQQQLQTEKADQERQRQELLRQAHDQAEADRRRLLAETEQLLQRRQEEVRQALERECAETLRAVRQEVVGQAVDLTRRLLHQSCDATLHRQLVLRLVEELQRLPGPERERLRTQWQPEDGVLLETASELDDASLQQLTGVVEAILGRPVPLTAQPRPDLLGGARLRVGGHVWDASLAGQLDGEQADAPEVAGHVG
jgi:F-type H+-transporting ATPase subunit b